MHSIIIMCYCEVSILVSCLDQNGRKGSVVWDQTMTWWKPTLNPKSFHLLQPWYANRSTSKFWLRWFQWRLLCLSRALHSFGFGCCIHLRQTASLGHGQCPIWTHFTDIRIHPLCGNFSRIVLIEQGHFLVQHFPIIWRTFFLSARYALLGSKCICIEISCKSKILRVIRNVSRDNTHRRLWALLKHHQRELDGIIFDHVQSGLGNHWSEANLPQKMSKMTLLKKSFLNASIILTLDSLSIDSKATIKLTY